MTTREPSDPKFDEIKPKDVKFDHVTFAQRWRNSRYFDNPWDTWKMSFAPLKLITFLSKINAETNNSPNYYDPELDNTLPIQSPIFLTKEPKKDCKIRLTWLGHASVFCQMDSIGILTDPVFSYRCSASQYFGPARYRSAPCAIKDFPPDSIDLVIISHNHYDHMDMSSIADLAKHHPNAVWCVPYGDKAKVSNHLHKYSAGKSIVVKEFLWWEEANLKTLKQDCNTNLRIVFTPTQHWSGRNIVFDKNAALWGSWALKSNNASFWFAGDTGYCPVFKEIGQQLGPFDAAAIPIGAYIPRDFLRSQHVDPKEAVQIHQDLLKKPDSKHMNFKHSLTAKRYVFLIVSIKRLLSNKDPSHFCCAIVSPLMRRVCSLFPVNKAPIAGEWITSNKSFPVLNPATGEEIAQVPALGAAEATRAIQAAHTGQPKWARLAPAERAKVIANWAENIRQNSSQLAVLIHHENGKSIDDANGEIGSAISGLLWYAEEAKRTPGHLLRSLNSTTKRLLVTHEPVGVVAVITPWNFPLSMITRKVGAALAAGCAVVLKPAEETPLSALASAALAGENLPSEVFSVVTAPREEAESVGDVFCQHPLVRIVGFTGSSAVGRHLYGKAATNLKRCNLELGGNAAFIVFESANLHQAVQGLMSCKFRCSGQTCISANRVLVQQSILPQFLALLSQNLAELKLAPLINHDAVGKVNRIVNESVNSGARIEYVGEQK
ncbi:Succinate-semialdehyde dehydrogenase, mitochondrial, partial [Cichlidogyrus casuarinus]